MLEKILEKRSWLEEIAESDLPVAVYGMGNGADKLFAFLEQQGIRPACVFASDEFVRGQQFRGYPVLRYEDAAAQYGKMNILPKKCRCSARAFPWPERIVPPGSFLRKTPSR